MDFKANWEIFLEDFIEAEGYKVCIKGLGITFLVALLGLFIGIIIGTIIAVIKVLPSQSIGAKICRKICDVYVGFFRGTPIVVQLLLGYFVIPGLLGTSWDSVVVCVCVFGLNSGAYVSEIMRGGIQSVDVGQMEAGRALGLSFSTTMLKIVVPQAIKNILPTLGNELIALIKETSVVSFVGTMDLCRSFQRIGDSSYRYVIPYLALAIIYIIIVVIFTLLIKLLEKYLHKSDRNPVRKKRAAA